MIKKLLTLLLMSVFFGSLSYADDIDRTTIKENLPFGNLETVPHLGNVVYAAQPDEATTRMLKDQGFDLVINIRELNEDLGFDEKTIIEEQGIDQGAWHVEQDRRRRLLGRRAQRRGDGDG